MAGLEKLCKQFGGLRVRDRDGKAVDWVWDYANNVAVKSPEMPEGSDRWKASERAKYGKYVADPNDKTSF
jgi:hypothetical protein